PIADLVPSANLVVTFFHANNTQAMMPTSSAPSTAQIAATLEVSCTTGAALPITAGTNDVVASYSLGIMSVNTRFITPTRISGVIASQGLASFSVSSGCSGSFTRLVP